MILILVYVGHNLNMSFLAEFPVKSANRAPKERYPLLYLLLRVSEGMSPIKHPSGGFLVHSLPYLAHRSQVVLSVAFWKLGVFDLSRSLQDIKSFQQSHKDLVCLKGQQEEASPRVLARNRCGRLEHFLAWFWVKHFSCRGSILAGLVFKSDVSHGEIPGSSCMLKMSAFSLRIAFWGNCE